MHTFLPTWLALSTAAILPTATAFYPYHYTSGKTASASRHSHRTSPQPPSPQAGTSRSITLPLRRIRTPSLRSRQNAYNIVNSNNPSLENSVAIDQDGSDLSYMVAVTFGDSTDEYHLLLDSAASNTWVMSEECESEACKTHATFGTADSSTLKTDASTPFSVTYGTGSSSGHLATDVLHLGPSLSPTLTFGLATNVSDEFRAYPMDGILGIGRGVQGTGDDEITAPQIMDLLSSQDLIGAKLYGIHLSRGEDGKMDGELNLGEVNKDRFTGDINYIECVDNESGFWEIPLQDAGVDGKSANLTTGVDRTAIMDTGTSFILIPEPDALALHSQIQGFEQDGETFFVPCDTRAAIQFSFNDRVYNISTADWVGGKDDGSELCRSNIVGRKTFGDNQWLVGDVFLKNVYSVFDFEGSRVGLGVLGQEQDVVAESESSTGTASPSASRTATGTGGASSNTAGAGQPQDQEGIATKSSTSTSFFALVGAFTALSIFM
ncbi:uncharacterized protein J4E84_007415 [Alternaria hordeiaustralica]|uniref:uncharacterized protein n=1 Tax=Alternaria hordeiaustralica TaxID=1187925 RepID=UPI0020C38A7E|nr:uncharacterized protein J4E84_007415 [Alternaria hordeiaustralica]KAI4681819.1 hypothetical protein J4E84_007415 [Alternaria hordeiaustralica]